MCAHCGQQRAQHGLEQRRRLGTRTYFRDGIDGNWRRRTRMPSSRGINDGIDVPICHFLFQVQGTASSQSFSFCG